MNGFEGFTDKDYQMSKMTAGTVVSIFIWVLLMVMGVLLG